MPPSSRWLPVTMAIYGNVPSWPIRKVSALQSDSPLCSAWNKAIGRTESPDFTVLRQLFTRSILRHAPRTFVVFAKHDRQFDHIGGFQLRGGNVVQHVGGGFAAGIRRGGQLQHARGMDALEGVESEFGAGVVGFVHDHQRLFGASRLAKEYLMLPRFAAVKPLCLRSASLTFSKRASWGLIPAKCGSKSSW